MTFIGSETTIGSILYLLGSFKRIFSNCLARRFLTAAVMRMPLLLVFAIEGMVALGLRAVQVLKHCKVQVAADLGELV